MNTFKIIKIKTPIKIPYSVVSGRVVSLKPFYHYFRSCHSSYLKLIGCKPVARTDVSVPVGSTSLCYFKYQFFSSGLGRMVAGKTLVIGT